MREPGAPPSTGKGRRIAWLALLPFLFGAAAGSAGLRLVPAYREDAGPAVVSASARLGKARTVVRLPLLGTVSAPTHTAPLEVSLTVDEVDSRALEQAFTGSAERQALARELRAGLETGAKGLAVRGLIGAGILGALAALVLPGRRFWWAGAGAAGGLMAAGLLFGLTASQFDVAAFQEPRFSGAVERAPQIIRAVQQRTGNIENLRSRVTSGAKRLSQVLSLAGQPLDNPHQGTVAILHISDIHSNPLGLELAKQLAINFKVDAIVDTGDITSFGEPIEARIAELLPAMPAPYLLVPGNHDSDENRAALAGTPNVTLLDKTVVDVKGVRIMGWADPAFTAQHGMSQDEADRLQAEEAPAVAAQVEAQAPAVLAVHNRLLAKESTGKVPLVLAGHRHREDKFEQKKTLFLEVGSTGATGLGSFVVEADHDYEAEVVYFRDARPVALDYIRLRGLGAEFEVQRQALAPSLPLRQPASAGGRVNAPPVTSLR